MKFSDIPTKVKAWTGAVFGLAAVVGLFFTVHPYFPPTLEASPAAVEADLKEQTDREQGDIQTQLDLLELEIKYYLDQIEDGKELSQSDQDRLDLAKKKRDRLTARLADILA